MLALLGLLTVILLIASIMTKKLTPTIAMIVIPTVMALIGGFGLEIGTFMTDGIRSIAPTVVMFIFGEIFFGVLSDAGA